jgi:hypothetical protein
MPSVHYSDTGTGSRTKRERAARSMSAVHLMADATRPVTNTVRNVPKADLRSLIRSPCMGPQCQGLFFHGTAPSCCNDQRGARKRHADRAIARRPCIRRSNWIETMMQACASGRCRRSSGALAASPCRLTSVAGPSTAAIAVPPLRPSCAVAAKDRWWYDRARSSSPPRSGSLLEYALDRHLPDGFRCLVAQCASVDFHGVPPDFSQIKT